MLMVVMSLPLQAQNKSSKVRNFEIAGLIGYRSNISFNTDPAVDGFYTKVGFDEGLAYGVSFGGRFNDDDVVEFRWARQDTNFTINGPTVPSSSQRVSIDQFHLDCSHEYVIENWRVWARPYIMASIGASRISGTSTFAGYTRVSFGMGGGIKVFPSEEWGFKVQLEWLPIVFNPQTQVACGNGCAIRFGGKLGTQTEITAGPIFRF
jgi:opacity protein-like surface antigen